MLRKQIRPLIAPNSQHLLSFRTNCSDSGQVQGLLFSAAHSQTFMEMGFLDRLANQLKTNKGPACRRAIQRILVRMKEHCESGQYQSTTDAENEFRRLVESDLACK